MSKYNYCLRLADTDAHIENIKDGTKSMSHIVHQIVKTIRIKHQTGEHNQLVSNRMGLEPKSNQTQTHVVHHHGNCKMREEP